MKTYKEFLGELSQTRATFVGAAVGSLLGPPGTMVGAAVGHAYADPKAIKARKDKARLRRDQNIESIKKRASKQISKLSGKHNSDRKKESIRKGRDRSIEKEIEKFNKSYNK